MRVTVAKAWFKQSDGGQDGGALVEPHVNGRLTPPQARVVHAGEVIENERGRVHHLGCASDVERIGHGSTEIHGRQQRQEGPNAFSRRQKRVTHRLVDSLRAAAPGRHKGIEPPVDCGSEVLDEGRVSK